MAEHDAFRPTRRASRIEKPCQVVVASHRVFERISRFDAVFNMPHTIRRIALADIDHIAYRLQLPFQFIENRYETIVDQQNFATGIVQPKGTSGGASRMLIGTNTPPAHGVAKKL